MTNPYPARLTFADGDPVIFDGEVDFTDPDNQPGGGGGGYTYSGDGSPVGVVDAAAIGSTYLDSTNGASYFATAAGSAGWVTVGGNAQPTDTGVVSTPGTATLQDGSGTVAEVSAGSFFAQVGVEGQTAALFGYNGEGVTVGDDDDGHTTLSFYGNAPVIQPAAPTLVAGTTPTLAAYGFTLAQAEAIIAICNAMAAALSNTNGGNGIMA